MRTKTSNHCLSIRAIVLAAVAVFILYFACLGSYPLIDPDEPIYGQVAKEMAAGGGWLTPHYAGQPWFDKPPLFYWLSGASAKLLGPTELASRLPSALLAVGVLVLLFALVKRDFGGRAAMFSTIAMATCLQTIILARAAVTDMTLLFCLLGALYAYRRWLDATLRATYAWMVVCGAMTGLGMLAKGPVAPVLLFTTFFIHLWRSGRLRRLISGDALLGVAAALMVGLPWFVAMYVIHRDAFVQGFLVANNLTRFLKPEHAGQTGGWYSYLLNIPTLLLFFFPWSVFLFGAIARYRTENDGARLAFIWLAVVFVFFSISKTQLPTYIFPLYPMAALFVGVLIDRAVSSDGAATAAFGRSSRYGLLPLALLLAAGFIFLGLHKYSSARLGIAAMAVSLALAAGAAAMCKPKMAVAILGTEMAAFAFILMLFVVPNIASDVSTRDLIREVPRRTGRVINYGLWKPSLFFYLGRVPERVTDPSRVKRMCLGDNPIWVVCKDKNLSKLMSEDIVVVGRRGGLVLLANEPAAGTKGFARVDKFPQYRLPNVQREGQHTRRHQ